MHYDKFTDSAFANEDRHLHRLIQNDKNKDINSEKTKEVNYCITPYIKMVNGKVCDITKIEIKETDVVQNITSKNYYSNRSEIQKLESVHYKERKSELYCYNRSDIKTMVGIVVTLPKEINDPVEKELFFKSTTAFLSNRYGEKNVVSAVIHGDEKEIGREHLHFYFIPSCGIDKEKLMSKKNHVKAMENFSEKISCQDVITKRDLQTVHTDLQKYLDERHINGKVKVKPDGSGKSINLSVEQLKELTNKTGIVLDERLDIERLADILIENQQVRIIDKQLKHEIEKVKSLEAQNLKLQEKVKTLEQQIERQQNHSWQRSQEQSSSWGHDRSSGWSASKGTEVERKW